MRYDRDAILERTDLARLADELLGPHRGRGPSATWPCPEPHHGPQTGRTPPVSIFTGRGGAPRWHCHACGAGGTAIDLVIVTHGLRIHDALEWLATRTGVTEPRDLPVLPRKRPAPAAPELPTLRAGTPALSSYVEACERLLWSVQGERWRAWLAARALPDAVLRANRVGADPGPARLDRAPGLPRRGPAVVFPVLTTGREPAYLQARYLDPQRAGRKYDNPAETLAPNPRVAPIHTPRASAHSGPLIVCEGSPDALTAASTGYHAAAILGASLPDGAIARRISQLAGRDAIVIAFDDDPGGRRGAHRLHELLQPMHRAPVTRFEPPGGDLNDWARRSGPDFAHELAVAIHSRVPANPAPAPTPALAP